MWKKTPLFAFVLSSTLALHGGDSLSVTAVMNAQDQEATGLSKLTPAQKLAFERWVALWTNNVLSQAPTYHPSQPLMQWVATWPPYLRPNPPSAKEMAREKELANRRIFRNDNGELIELKDGSLWKIHPTDVQLACWWERNQPITIAKSTRDIARPYVLQNTARDEQAGAKQLRTASAQGERQADPSAYFRGAMLLESIAPNAETLTVEGSGVWKIAPVSQLQISCLWRVRDRLRIERSGDARYRYRIINFDNGGSGLATPG